MADTTMTPRGGGAQTRASSPKKGDQVRHVFQHQAAEHPVDRPVVEGQPGGHVMEVKAHSLGARLGPRDLEHAR